MSVLEFVASLVSSIAWPAVAIVLGLVFRKQFKNLLTELAKRFGRLKSLKGGGFEAQFEDLKELEAEAVRQGRASGTYGWAAAAASAKLPIEVMPEADAMFERARPESEYVRLHPGVRSLLIKARTTVDRDPREAVLLAGRALERSIDLALESLGVPIELVARPYTEIGIGDLDEAGMIIQLHRLYESAARDSDEEITGLSALQYIERVEQAVARLALAVREKELHNGASGSTTD